MLSSCASLPDAICTSMRTKITRQELYEALADPQRVAYVRTPSPPHEEKCYFVLGKTSTNRILAILYADDMGYSPNGLPRNMNNEPISARRLPIHMVKCMFPCCNELKCYKQHLTKP